MSLLTPAGIALLVGIWLTAKARPWPHSHCRLQPAPLHPLHPLRAADTPGYATHMGELKAGYVAAEITKTLATSRTLGAGRLPASAADLPKFLKLGYVIQ